MGIFGGQFANVVEWEEYRDDILFWKWTNREIKKGSRLIIKQGQDAIFMYNGRVEGIFTDEGSFDIESDIIPFLSTLKGFKFGFNSGIRAEVLFINTKELTVKWGTKNAILIPAPGLPGGMPIRSFGTFNCKVTDPAVLIEKIAGVKKQFTIDDVKERVIAMLDQLMMKWISTEGKDMFNLQANSFEIAKGIREDLDMEMFKIGIGITGFNIASFSYPEEVQNMANKVASQSMIGDMGRYQQASVIEGMSKGDTAAGNMASNVAGMQMGMMMGQQLANQMNQGQQTGQGQQPAQPGQSQQEPGQSGQAAPPNFCPNCGTKTNGAKFCANCGTKLV
ncbi:SPFH domain-containing protein [Anaerobium acetethylicum]|uniref:Membrane protease subunit, stomatin/prohibitin family, contains C-terminal Zn-ribbon domain n=1 Tax=Anaerobium acetethylicum TaxID=1619234 RepID=A0A1D3TY53_9FIRM|nr:SPFH domain-containing protein [Anaerobium acetethylicum]SCP99320.1 Membrane protease subunit, stomatin/prohibitin family, contains C-terminal Zn-ribbon domain [Anaerobium acetethylicum]